MTAPIVTPHDLRALSGVNAGEARRLRQEAARYLALAAELEAVGVRP